MEKRDGATKEERREQEGEKDVRVGTPVVGTKTAKAERGETWTDMARKAGMEGFIVMRSGWKGRKGSALFDDGVVGDHLIYSLAQGESVEDVIATCKLQSQFASIWRRCVSVIMQVESSAIFTQLHYRKIISS